MAKEFFEILQDVRSVWKLCRNFILKKWLFKSRTSFSQPDDLQHLSILGRLWVTRCFLTLRILNMIKFEPSFSPLLLGWKSANSNFFNPNKRKRMLFYGNMFLSRTVGAVTENCIISPWKNRRTFHLLLRPIRIITSWWVSWNWILIITNPITRRSFLFYSIIYIM